MELKHWAIIGSTASVLMASAVLFVPKVNEIANDITKEFRDYKPPPSEVVDFVLDNTDGSTGTKENLSTMLDLWLPWVAEATGSGLRIICQGQQGTTATIVFETQSKPPSQNTEKARRAYVLRFVQTTKALALTATEICFANVNQSQSPIAETITWTALQSPPANLPLESRRRIITFTDARQVSKLADFECDRPLPTKDELLKRLHTSRVLDPGSLQDISIAFVFVETRPVIRSGCPLMTIERMIQIRELWTHVCEKAGATEVIIRTGALAPKEMQAPKVQS